MNLKAISTGALLVYMLALPIPAEKIPETSGPMPAAVVESAGVSVAAAKHQPKAAIGAAYTILPTTKVRVQVRSNATKVQVTYRSARNAKRSTVKKLKRGAATLTLPAGSKRITVRARATRRLAASPWIRATPLAPPAQGDPVQQPASGGATTGTLPDAYTVDTYIPPTITHLATYATMASGTWEIVSEYRIVAPMPYILTGDYANDYETVHPAGESIAFEREANPSFTRGDGCIALAMLSVTAPTSTLLFHTYGGPDGIGGDLMPPGPGARSDRSAPLNRREARIGWPRRTPSPESG